MSITPAAQTQATPRRPSASLALVGVEPVDAASQELFAATAREVHFFPDRDAFLASPGCYEHDFIVVGGDMGLRDGVALVALLRRRSTAHLLAWRARAPAAAWLDGGVDLWLPRSATPEDLSAGLRAVQRRRLLGGAPLASGAVSFWTLERSGKRLHTPSGVAIALNTSDVDALAVFAAAQGNTVPFAALKAAFEHERASGNAEADNLLHAAMYRLRRRIERGTDEILPLSSQAGVGYVFRAPILEA